MLLLQEFVSPDYSPHLGCFLSVEMAGRLPLGDKQLLTEAGTLPGTFSVCKCVCPWAALQGGLGYGRAWVSVPECACVRACVRACLSPDLASAACYS